MPLTPVRLDLSAVGLDLGARARTGAAAPLAQELLRTRLAARLGCDPDDVEPVRDRAAADWAAYVHGLLDDASVTELVMDFAQESVRPEEVAAQAAVTGRPVHNLQRLEPLIDRLVGAGATTAEILTAVERMVSAAAEAGACGFKTVLAYRTGLAVDPGATMTQADASLRSAAPVRRRGKACRDLVLRRVLGILADLGLPLQIHTGFGDSDLRLADSHPLLLEEVLRTPEGSAAKVVLIHGSFPWLTELAHLAGTRPNVWAELSLFPLFAPAAASAALLTVVGLAPPGRIVAGTDGHGQPETIWFAARVLQDAWADARERLVDGGARPEWADAVGRSLLTDNARELYRR